MTVGAERSPQRAHDGPGADAGDDRAGAPDAAYVLALADLPGMGPRRLGELLSGLGAREAWRAVVAGEVVRTIRGAVEPGAPWAEAAVRADVAGRWQAVERARIGITWPGAPDWPAGLASDPQPPGVLFWRGRLAALRRPAVAIVGTRHATAEGRAVAFELGRELTGAGVTVVSGLALGIDGAAHAGAVEDVAAAGAAPPVGVAASGVDTPYPRRHSALWARVAEAGVVISETPPGGAASTWRFPWRNRIIAALADLVVVVESQERGGSLLTAEAALARGVDVGAVPGPVRAASSAGTNQLLVDGAIPIRHAGDALDALGLGGTWREPPPPALPLLDPEDQRVLDAVAWEATTFSRVVERSGLPVAAVGRHLDHLRGLGLVADDGGRWARCGPRQAL